MSIHDANNDNINRENSPNKTIEKIKKLLGEYDSSLQEYQKALLNLEDFQKPQSQKSSKNP